MMSLLSLRRMPLSIPTHRLRPQPPMPRQQMRSHRHTRTLLIRIRLIPNLIRISRPITTPIPRRQPPHRRATMQTTRILYIRPRFRRYSKRTRPPLRRQTRSMTLLGLRSRIIRRLKRRLLHSRRSLNLHARVGVVSLIVRSCLRKQCSLLQMNRRCSVVGTLRASVAVLE